jgi:hypothetical protein
MYRAPTLFDAQTAQRPKGLTTHRAGPPHQDAIPTLPNEQEQMMKLNSTQTEQALNQFEAQVLPDDHPAQTELSGIFGDHTFFLDGSGLNVLEPAETAEPDAQTGEIVSLASWSDATLTSLRPHEPEPTGVIVMLERTQ